VSFTLSSLGMRYGTVEVLSGVTAALRAGQFTAIVGPNGAGKSTLLGILAGLKTNYTGEAAYAGRGLRDWRRRDLARLVSFLPQSVHIDFPFTAGQIVLMGRTPHGDGWFESAADRDSATRAMELTDCLHYRNRDFRSLSGGERQRVLLAAALAQEPRALLLDEPATYLDLKHQIDLYKLLQKLAGGGLLVAAVTHDLNLAAHYADCILMLDHGRLAGIGSPESVITAAALREVFHVDAAVRPVIEYGN
jgi:iron complex transport system ATP-binding protein